MRSNRGEHDPGPALFLCAACLCCVRGGVTASRLHQTPPEEQETGRTCCGSWERWIWGFLSSGTCLLCGAGHEWRWVLLGFAALSFGLQASSCLFRVPGSWNQLGVSGADALPSSSSFPCSLAAATAAGLAQEPGGVGWFLVPDAPPKPPVEFPPPLGRGVGLWLLRSPPHGRFSPPRSLLHETTEAVLLRGAVGDKQRLVLREATSLCPGSCPPRQGPPGSPGMNAGPLLYPCILPGSQ